MQIVLARARQLIKFYSTKLYKGIINTPIKFYTVVTKLLTEIIIVRSDHVSNIKPIYFLEIKAQEPPFHYIASINVTLIFYDFGV